MGIEEEETALARLLSNYLSKMLFKDRFIHLN